MRISTKGRYGLRVMMELARRYGEGPIPAEEIAKSQEISGKYIHLLVKDLRSAGLVRTIRGPNGGYALSRVPSLITALDVISALEGRLAPVDCVLDLESCSRSGQCIAREIWCEVSSAVDEVLSGVTLEQLSARQSAKQDEQLTYVI